MDVLWSKLTVTRTINNDWRLPCWRSKAFDVWLPSPARQSRWRKFYYLFSRPRFDFKSTLSVAAHALVQAPRKRSYAMNTLKFMVVGLIFSSAVSADGHGWHHGHHHHGHGPIIRERIIYMPPRVVEYVPVPRYYAPPPPPVYYRYEQRSPTGLLGGVVGGAMGYQFGGGDPLAAGVGAAAGAWLGNGRY